MRVRPCCNPPLAPSAPHSSATGPRPATCAMTISVFVIEPLQEKSQRCVLVVLMAMRSRAWAGLDQHLKILEQTGEDASRTELEAMTDLASRQGGPHKQAGAQDLQGMSQPMLNGLQCVGWEYSGKDCTEKVRVAIFICRDRETG